MQFLHKKIMKHLWSREQPDIDKLLKVYIMYIILDQCYKFYISRKRGTWRGYNSMGVQSVLQRAQSRNNR